MSSFYYQYQNTLRVMHNSTFFLKIVSNYISNSNYNHFTKKRWQSIKAGTHERACSSNTLPQHAPGAKLARVYQRKICDATKGAKPESKSFVAPHVFRWYIRGSFAPGACCGNVLREQAPSCVSAFMELECYNAQKKRLLYC